MGKTKVIVLLILCFSLSSIENLIASKATSIEQIQFSSGVTVFSPLNSTYNTKFVSLNMTFDIGAGLDCSLNYSIDGNDLGHIPLVSIDTEFILKGQKSGLVQLPELNEGTHYLTIDVLCGLYDYQGNPPGAPFTPTFPGSFDYTATWTHTIQFTIDAPSQNPDKNWVEVVSYSGVGSTTGATPLFMINHEEWRIKWEYVPMVPVGPQNDFTFFLVPEENRIEGQFNSGMSIAEVRFPTEKNGNLHFFNQTGDFFLHFIPGNAKWTVTVEQNIESIPEFPTNFIVVAILVSCSIVIVYKKLGHKQKDKIT